MKCAVYRHFDKDGGLLYVGMSTNPIARTEAHLSSAPWRLHIANIAFEWHSNVGFARAAEARAIATEKPLHNIQPRAKETGAAAFLASVDVDDLAARIGVGLHSIRAAKLKDQMPSCWALVVAQVCIEQGLTCPMTAFRWLGKAKPQDCCISTRLFPIGQVGA